MLRLILEKIGFKKTSSENLLLIDNLLESVNKLPEVNGKAELRYRKNYISIYHNNYTVAYCSPKKSFVRVGVSLTRTTEIDNLLDETNIDFMDYNVKLGRYRVRLYPSDKMDYTIIEKLLSDSIQEKCD